MNRKRLVVLLEDKIHIFDISNMRSLHVMDIPPNPKGIMALSPDSDNMYLAYPVSSTTGRVNIFDPVATQDVNILQAHKNPITCLAFGFDGLRLATASEQGTVIRVFNVADTTLLYQLRRGTYATRISSLSFNLDATLLVTSSSESDTVHIFRLDRPVRQNRNSVTSFLPASVSGMLDTSRDFAHFKLPQAGVESVCAIGAAPQVMVATSEGNFYVYSMDPELGGECVLLKTYRCAAAALARPAAAIDSRNAAASLLDADDGKASMAHVLT